ncbi:TetR/AcrR family transcriptional regulator [Spongiactinospora sp. TRM90649]|uniref:TetR/AcrR family transcriptional regulator n=1 Tax=Spongiactinospora sp. TRM90649 TaxID=3031114 RepID=UPI0023F9601D|nr:TetR/AcrR family transcriptional regulator [Spongiactinospora sp. TRM90649]MDF5752162.1 TetR/AcrR family transcriptional regulator [Spongiactinospora sp. TRM90649]
MPRQADPRKKQRILSIATDLFAANGYHGTGTAQIAEAAGIGKSALYHHIKSKEDALFEISRLLLEELVQAGERIQRKTGPADEKLRQLSRELIRNIGANLTAWRVVSAEFDQLTSYRKRIIAELRRSYEGTWLAVIDSGTAEGLFRAIDPVQAKAIITMHSQTHLWLRHNGRLTPDEVADQLCDLVLLGVGASHHGNGPPAAAS